MIPYLGVLGAGGGGAESGTCGTRASPGRSQRVCISLQPARADAPSERAGSPKVLPGTAKGGLGDPAQSPEENLGVTLGLQRGFQGALSGLRGTSFAQQDGLGGKSSVFEFPGVLDRGESSKVVLQVFFSGSAAVAAGHLVCTTFRD